ncbi:hypothetical protein HMPREF2998_00475 [Corynebacterium sp. HMSC065A05]|uniref:hypothetical protein n=1 Tax=Corynebacterium sp. HMSC065A05 TaxID=1739502 RepID=UPI0008A2B1D7|nr:hypothetical protein [Corynebacterium sp. HMSC065A05]OFP15994.1 hypothetical protein HMPREF2998_00475 [Corynebacterium sp. HMSC065A05]
MARHFKAEQVATPIAELVYRELADQPWFARYKATILMVLQALAWLAGVLPVMLADAPAWVIAVAGGAGSIITVLVNRFTQDGVTPSMAPRLEQRAIIEEQKHTQPTASLPVYTGPTTAGE